MNKKIVFQINICLVILLCVFATQTQAQTYHHAYGAQIDFGIIDQEYTNFGGELISNKEFPTIPGVMYKATLEFSDNFAVSAYPFLGFYANFNTVSGGEGGIGFQIPAVAELYFGDLDDVCFIAGGGLAYSYINASNSGTGSVFGPQLALGGQFEWQRRLIGLRLAYTHGIQSLGDNPDMAFSKDNRRLFTLSVYNVIGYR